MLAAMTLAGCKNDDPAPAQQPEPPAKKTAETAEEVLSQIPGVIVIQNTLDAKGNPITYFYFEQLIDQRNAGTSPDLT